MSFCDLCGAREHDCDLARDDRLVAEKARAYVAARMRMSESKEDTLTLICNVDLAWAELVDSIDLDR